MFINTMTSLKYHCIKIVSELHYVFQQRNAMREIRNTMQYF